MEVSGKQSESHCVSCSFPTFNSTMKHASSTRDKCSVNKNQNLPSFLQHTYHKLPGRKVQSLEKCSQNCMAEAQLAGQWGRGLIPCMKCTSPLAGPISKVCPAAGTRPLVDTTVQHKRHWAEKNLIDKICIEAAEGIRAMQEKEH